MNLKVNPFSPTFWSAASGVAGIICGAIGVGSLSSPVEAVITAVGGVLLAIPAHHTVAAAVKSPKGA